MFLAFHWLLSPEPEITKYPVPLIEDLLLHENYLLPTKLTWLRQTMRVSHDTVLSPVCVTTGQQKNMMWMTLRKYRFTASKFGDLIKAVPKQRYCFLLYENNYCTHISMFKLNIVNT